MKRLSLGVFVFSLILVLSACSDDDSSDSENSIKKYSELPIKKDLSYFMNPQDIAGQAILRPDNPRTSLFINKYEVSGVGWAKINSKGFSEFEIDDFEIKLKEEFAKSIQLIRDAYKNVDKHIRIVNLNIPVRYSKISKAVASIKIRDTRFLQKLNYSKPMLPSDFIKEELNNEYISQYIIPSKYKINFENVVNYDESLYSGGLKVQGDAKFLNDIGKTNKGNDTITELTLHVMDSQNNYSYKHETEFVITSFKLKSISKRFITNKYIDTIKTAQSFGNKYFIESDD